MATNARCRIASANMLSAAIALACAATLATVSAASASGWPTDRGAIVVSNCADSGDGSLRNALASASDGDTIDLTQLTCSTITLTTGTLATTLDSFTLTGPGPDALRIVGTGDSSVLEHRGEGTVTVSGMGFSDGYNRSPVYAEGGCIHSSGNLILSDTLVTNCRAAATPTAIPVTVSRGGGVFARGNLTLIRSSLKGNSVSTSPARYMYANGGGVYARGDLLMQESTITSNAVHGSDEPYFSSSYRSGGGVFARAGVTIESSTVNDNYAYFAGGLDLSGGGDVAIINSTISGNHAEFRTGGIATGGYSVEVHNSTIALNHAAWSGFSGGPTGAGLLLFTQGEVWIRSTIIAKNSAGPEPDDLCQNWGDAISGSGNLIMTSAFQVPADTIAEDPMLLPLSDNGGATATHAISAKSPAFGRGNNAYGLEYDQRGSGYGRVSGGAADIGAFEYQLGDAIFADGFESPPTSIPDT